MQLLASLAGERSTSKTTASNGDTEKSKYRGVEVIGSHAGCCEEVRAIAGKRFLSSEVPKLPLDGCDAGACDCSYKLFDDRRDDVRRGSDVAFDMVGQYREHDNRSSTSSGRRTSDS